MVLTILTTFWLCIAACILALGIRTKKGRMMSKTLWRSTKVRIALVLPPVIIAIIAIVFFFQPKVQPEQIEPGIIFRDYSRTLVEGLAKQGAITIDPACELDEPRPELAYMLPALVQLDDTLRLSFDGYKQFKNRTINIIKGAKKKLGPRYTFDMESQGETHTLIVTYKGEAWRNEQLCALPATEAGIRESTDAALLMSITRHISDFDFNYEGSKRERGLLALDTGEGLEQMFIGARRLRMALDTAQNTEDAVAAFYPIHDMQTMHSEWRKSPLKSSWVREVLKDVQYYRANGMK